LRSLRFKVYFNAETKEIVGDGIMTGIKYQDVTTKEIKELAVGGAFVEIGTVPNSELVKDLVQLNRSGEMVVDAKTQRASLEGIWAAGDVCDSLYKQNNIAVGDAIKAALDIYFISIGLNNPMVAILHNIRSLYNVGSIFRTADAAGIEKIYLCGITPEPIDKFGRLRPQLTKVSLGAESSVQWERVASTTRLIDRLKKDKYKIIAIEQSERSIHYSKVKTNSLGQRQRCSGQ